MKKIIIIVAVVGILAILVLSLKYFLPKKITILPITKTIIEKQYYDMDINIPDKEMAKSKFVELFDFVAKQISDFDKDFGNLSEEDVNFIDFDDCIKYEFIINTKIATTSKTVSYILETYTYTGGAHGGTSVKAFTYDINGKLININNIFNITEWQKIISEKVREYFKPKIGEYLDEESLKTGTEPNGENFNIWYLEGDSIFFIFGQYQIGPYVLGIQEFPLPLKGIEDILDINFKL